jgi:hypothetical protein
MGPLEHVPFVELYPRRQKQFPVLLRKRGLAMMLFLSLDIFDKAINVARRAGERGVALLPVRNPLSTEFSLIQRAEPVLISLTKSARLTVGCKLLRM